jgi:hypothetical protein
LTKGYDEAFPIIVWKGQDIIVDGHHRYKACQELDVEPAIYEHEFNSHDEAELYALEHQDLSRHETDTQRAVNVCKQKALRGKIEEEAENRRLSNLKRGSEKPTPAAVVVGVVASDPQETETQEALGVVAEQALETPVSDSADRRSREGKTSEVLGKKAGVGGRTIERVDTVLLDGHPTLETMMMNKELAADTAYAFVKFVSTSRTG